MSETHGKGLNTTIYLDTKHAGDLMTHNLQSGVLIYVNSVPIFWYSKGQNTVENSTFASDFVALRVVTEMVKILHY